MNTTFLATICHELRNPLSAMIGCAEILKTDHDHLKNEEYLEFVEAIKKSGKEALKLVEDIMAISKYNADRFSVDLSKKIDVKEVILRSIALKKLEAMQRGIKIINNVANVEIALINLDFDRMRQVLVNLISNAIKYSPDNTQITIDAKVVDGLHYEDRLVKSATLQIDVIDQGFGMTKEDITTAMQPYGTINNPNSGKVDCFGLGLPLVKELVELQKGKMFIQSKKGEGTTISLFFNC